MEKSIQKQKAIDLYRSGYSFGAIAKQIGEAKSSVYRWINEDKEDNGTPETPVGTGFGTDLERNETDLHEELQNGPIDSRNWNDFETESTKLSEVEKRKAELQHEYRMEQLKFQQEQYRDKKRESQLAKEEMARWRQKINEIGTKTESLQNEKVETNEQIPLLIPVKFISRLGDLLKQYLHYDDNDCSLESLELIEEKVNDLYAEIIDWAKDYDFTIENDEINTIFYSFISDLDETLDNFATEEADVLSLTFDKSWKTDMQDWLELNS